MTFNDLKFNLMLILQKRSQQPMYKTDTKYEARRLRATTFAIAKFEEQELNLEQYRKVPYLKIYM